MKENFNSDSTPGFEPGLVWLRLGLSPAVPRRPEENQNHRYCKISNRNDNQKQNIKLKSNSSYSRYYAGAGIRTRDCRVRAWPLIHNATAAHSYKAQENNYFNVIYKLYIIIKRPKEKPRRNLSYLRLAAIAQYTLKDFIFLEITLLYKLYVSLIVQIHSTIENSPPYRSRRKITIIIETYLR